MLETVLTGRNLLSPVLTGAAADVTAFDAKVAASQEKASASAQANARAQTTAADRVMAANTRQAESASVASSKVVSANARAAESARLFADASESSAARTAASFGSLATKALPIAAAATVVVFGKMAGDYQSALTRLSTTAGESQKNLGMVGQGMLDMSGQVGVGAQELAKGMYTVDSAGIHGADSLIVLKAAAQGAKQENADLTHVVDAVTTSLHDFHLPASQAATVTSELIAAVSHGKTTFDDLTAAMHSVEPRAAAVGMSIGQTAGALAAMTSSGMHAEQAAQNLGHSISSLSNMTKPMRDELYALGLNAQDLQDHLGQRGVAGTLQLVSDAIVRKLGPSGKLALDALSKNKTAVADLNIMMQAMPAPLAKLSQGLLTGTTSVSAYSKAAKGLGGEQAAMALQFLSLYRNSDGFNAILKAGGPAVQTYIGALAKATGTSDGLNVALQLTGENATGANSAIGAVSKAAADAHGNVSGWDEVQGNLNQKLAEAGGVAGKLAIEAGQHLLPVLTGIVGWVGSTGLPAIGHLGSAVGDLVHDFQQLPGPVKAVAEVMATLALANAIGLTAKLGEGLAFLSGGMTRFAAATTASMGAVSAAYSAAASEARIASVVMGGAYAPMGRMSGAMAGIGAAASTTARGGLSMLRSGAGSLIGFLGGPWMVGLAAAGGAVYMMNKAVEDHKKQIEADTASVKSWYEAMASKGGQAGVDAMNNIRSKTLEAAKAEAELTRIQAEHIPVAGKYNSAGFMQAQAIAAQKTKIGEISGELVKGKKAWDDYYNSLSPQGQADATVARYEGDIALAVKTHTTNTVAGKNAVINYNSALAEQKRITQGVSAAEQTQIEKLQQLADIQLGAVSSALAATQAQSQFGDAVSQYNKDAKDGQHSTKQLADESNNLASQAISTAQAIGKQEHDQLKATGAADDGTVANKLMLQSLKDSADQITGPGHDALMKAYNDLLKASAAATSMKDAATMMGLNVVKTFDNNTAVIHGATKAQIADLQKLGDKVTTLPDGNIIVTSDTHMARATLDALINDYNNKVVRVMTSTGQHISSATGPGGTSVKGAATGGPIVGPGTGTSDTAGLWALSNGEHVWTAAETAAAGGHPGVEALRKAVLAQGRGRANGGPIGWEMGPWDLSTGSIAKFQAATAAAVARQQAAAAAASFAGGGGGAGSPAIRELGRQIAMQSGYGSQFNAIDFVFSHESGWNPNAQNPTSSAYGIPQFLNSTWAAYGGKTSDAGMQIRDGIAYMRDRYGSPDAAASFWAAHHWYKNGTNFVPSDQLAVLHKGEAVVPAAVNQGRPFTPTGAPGYSPAPVGHTTVTVAAPQVTVQARVFLGDREITDIVRVEATSVVKGRLEDLHRKKSYR